MSDPAQVGTILLLLALFATLAVAIRRRAVSAVVNAVVSLGVATVPATFQVVQSGGVGPELPLWIAVAGLLHSVGMLGLYDTVWWWDHLTHTLSASLVAALVYAALLVVGQHPPDLGVGVVGAGAITVLAVFAAGVFWELIELVARSVAERFDVEPILVYYGVWDTGLDLVFDLVGALLIVALDVRTFVPLAAASPGTTRQVLVWAAGVIVVGSVAMAAYVIVDERTRRVAERR